MCACPGDCEGGPECLDDEGGPLGLAALAELTARIGHVPRRELHCHRDVRLYLALALPEAEPSFPGSIGALAGIPVFEQADFGPGAWEIREDGEVTASGHVDVPPWVTAPVALDVTFPRMIDRAHSWFPCAPPAPFRLSGIA